jgi:predicted RNA-binding protein with PUA-like domain
MANWLLKTEPEDFSWDDLEKGGTSVWDGVTNNLALKHMRAVAPGDRVFLYHTGKERAIVGIAEVAGAPYPDPKRKDPRIVVFELRPERKLRRPVTLAEIKADGAFSDFLLVRMSRLSVMPVSDSHWKRIQTMAG